MTTKSFHDFENLQEAVDYFENHGIEPFDVKIGGAFGGSEPVNDDPVFFYEEP